MRANLEEESFSRKKILHFHTLEYLCSQNYSDV